MCRCGECVLFSLLLLPLLPRGHHNGKWHLRECHSHSSTDKVGPPSRPRPPWPSSGLITIPFPLGCLIGICAADGRRSCYVDPLTHTLAHTRTHTRTRTLHILPSCNRLPPPPLFFSPKQCDGTVWGFWSNAHRTGIDSELVLARHGSMMGSSCNFGSRPSAL